MKTPNPASPSRLCGVRLTDGMMAQLVAEAARQTVERGRNVSVAAVVRAAVGSYLGREAGEAPRRCDEDR